MSHDSSSASQPERADNKSNSTFFKVKKLVLAFCAGAMMASAATGVGIGAMSLASVGQNAPLSTEQVAAVVLQKAGIEATNVWPVAGDVYMLSANGSKLFFAANSQLLIKGDAFDITSGEDAASMVVHKYGLTPQEAIGWRVGGGSVQRNAEKAGAISPADEPFAPAKPSEVPALRTQQLDRPSQSATTQGQQPALPQGQVAKTSATGAKPPAANKKMGLSDYIVMLTQMPPSARAKEGLEIAKMFIPELPDEKLIVYRSPTERAVITIFSDPTCGYCKALHASTQELLDNGVTVRIYPYIRGRLDGQRTSASSPSTFDVYLENVTSGPLGHVAAGLRDAYCMRQDPTVFDSIMSGSARRSPEGDIRLCDTDFRSMKVYADMFVSNRTPVIIIGSAKTDISKRHVLAGVDGINDILSKI